MNKKIMALILAAVMVFSFVACGSEAASSASSAAESQAESTSAAEETKTYKVGISMFVMDAGMTALSGLMEESLKAADIPIEVVITSADSSMEKQNSDVEDLVSQGCDLIWLQGFDQDAITGALDYAKNAGKIVAIGQNVNSDNYDYMYQNAPITETGEMQAEWFAEKYMKVNPDTQYKIALCNGTMSTTGAAGRRDGVIMGLEASGCTNYEVVVEQDCDYITETAQAWAEGLMTSHPEINVIFCANDDMALGVANAIEAVGRTGEIILIGTDGHDTGIALMSEGKMAMTIRMNVENIGSSMAQTMIDALKGTLKTDENKIAYADAAKIYTVVDETNLADYQ